VAAETTESSSAGAARLGRVAMGERLGGFIYGTIVVLSVIVGGAKAYRHEPGHLAVVVAVTVVVFWLAHVYSHAVGESLARSEHLSFAELLHLARREGSIVEAAVPSLVALLLGAFGVLSGYTAIWIAFGLGLAVLGAEGLMFARAERLGPIGTCVLVAVNLGLGAILVALKLFISH
jgi:hypothetical protein